MKLVSRQEGRIVFSLGRREAETFQVMLSRFPLIPPAYHQVTKGGIDATAHQAQTLLDEALKTEQVALATAAQNLLEDPERFAPDGKRWLLTLSEEDADWLLRLINDLRVGSWIKLKCPDFDAAKPPRFRASDLKYLALMESAGRFEIALIEALNGPAT